MNLSIGKDPIHLCTISIAFDINSCDALISVVAVIVVANTLEEHEGINLFA